MIGNKVCFFKSLDSTNSFMKEHLSNYSDGDMICANVQTKGRGRRNNNWISRKGDLHFSFIINNKEKIYSFNVIRMVSNAVCNVLLNYGVDANIKYPNDIVVGNKKITGILIERVIKDDDYFVVGIGINVITKDFDDLNFKATSILLETGDTYDYRDVLMSFINEYNKLLECSDIDLHKNFLKRSVVLGKTIIIENKEYEVTDINYQGLLMLERNGEKTVKQMNEVTLKDYYNES